MTLWAHRASAFNIDAIYDPNESKLVVVLLVVVPLSRPTAVCSAATTLYVSLCSPSFLNLLFVAA